MYRIKCTSWIGDIPNKSEKVALTEATVVRANTDTYTFIGASEKQTHARTYERTND